MNITYKDLLKLKEGLVIDLSNSVVIDNGIGLLDNSYYPYFKLRDPINYNMDMYTLDITCKLCGKVMTQEDNKEEYDNGHKCGEV